MMPERNRTLIISIIALPIIRTAKTFTDDRTFEMWHGMECICHGTSEVPSMNGERAA